jgi:hypothetical protein
VPRSPGAGVVDRISEAWQGSSGAPFAFQALPEARSATILGKCSSLHYLYNGGDHKRSLTRCQRATTTAVVVVYFAWQSDPAREGHAAMGIPKPLGERPTLS